MGAGNIYGKGRKSVPLLFCSSISLKIKKICSPVCDLFSNEENLFS